MKNILFLSTLLFIFAACEDVIDIDLKSTEPYVVIEGHITQEMGKSYVKLTRSTDYFEPGVYPEISGAQVTVSDNLGTIYNLEETETGTYTLPGFYGVENRTYSLKVTIDNQVYDGQVTMPERLTIDHLSYMETPDYMEFSGGYLVSCHVVDPPQQHNYYQIKVYNIQDTNQANQTLVIYDDAFVDGNTLDMQWEQDQFFPGDTVVAELMTLASSTFDYYTMLNSVLDNSMMGSTTPANPDNNLSNGALGYWGAYAITRDTLIIPVQN